MNPSSKLDRAVMHLAASTLRRTVPRFMVLKALAESEQPLTVDEVHQRVGKSSCNLVSVYRIMDSFDEAGLVNRHFQASGASLYSLNLGEVEPLVVDRDTGMCHRIDDLDIIRLQALMRELEAKLALRGFTEISAVIQFFGREASPHPEKPARYTVKPASRRFIEKQMAEATQRMEKPVKTRCPISTQSDRTAPK